MNYDGAILRFFEKEDYEKLLQELHDGPAGGNFAINSIAHKIIREGYYWPMVFRYTHAYVRRCKVC